MSALALLSNYGECNYFIARLGTINFHPEMPVCLLSTADELESYGIYDT